MRRMKPLVELTLTPATDAAAQAGQHFSEVRPGLRSDGLEARSHLLLTALRLFSQNGFAKTSTREIAQAAGVNLAAIRYYFGDKASLYRAVFTEPQGMPCDDIARFAPRHLSLREALAGFIAGFIEPLKMGDLSQQMTRLHFREMLEPTGLWAEQIDNSIKPSHAALLAVLARHLGIALLPEGLDANAAADDDLHRLAFSITGLAIQMFISRDVMDSVRPSLVGSHAAIDQWSERLVDHAEALVECERARRQAQLQAG